MSGIFGLGYLDGRPLPAACLDTIARAMDPWGPHGVSVACQGSAGFGFAHLRTTPEGHHERQPMRLSQAGGLIAATARLDNRDELCELFRIPLTERFAIADGRLVTLAYERFGEDTPRHLFGDWSFAVWNERSSQLFVARDHLGNTGLFYYFKPPFFAFASTVKALLALPEVATGLDERTLARYLAIFPGDEQEWDQTFWRDIRLLLPAHSLTLSPQGFGLRRYWRLEEVTPLAPRTDEDYLEGFLDHYRRAVRVRLRSERPVGTQLSAGLDSSSVTALVAEALLETGQTLTAFTAVPLHPADHLVPGALADEWPLAQTVAAAYPHIDHVPVRAVGVSPLLAVKTALELFDGPLHAAANLFWIQALHEEARQRGLGVLLTGQLGNGGVSWSGGTQRIYFDLIQGRIGKALRDLRACQAHQGLSWYRTIRRHLLSPLLGPLWHRWGHWQGRLLDPGEAPWSGYSAIHPDFAARMGLREALARQDQASAARQRLDPAWQRRRIIELNAPLCYIHHHVGAATRMDVRDPTADVRLLEFCFGIPDDQFTYGGGERMVLRRSLADQLPEAIRWNTVRGRQAADLGLRLLDHRTAMDETLRHLAGQAAVRAYLDTDALQAVWQDLQRRVTPKTNRRAASLLLRGIMAGLWILSLSVRRGAASRGNLV